MRKREPGDGGLVLVYCVSRGGVLLDGLGSGTHRLSSSSEFEFESLRSRANVCEWLGGLNEGNGSLIAVYLAAY